MEELLNSYGLTEEGLTDRFKAFVEACETAVHSTALYYKSQGGDEEAYSNFVKLVEFVISDDDKKTAEKFDELLPGNASVHYGSYRGDVMLKQFEGKGSFETVCQWCLYRVIYESHPALP